MAELTAQTTAQEFFEIIVPELAKKRKSELTAEQMLLSHSIGITLEGEGGGSWTLQFDKGTFSVLTGIESGANPVLVTDVQNWKDAVSGKRPIPGMDKPDLMAGDPAMLKPKALEMLANVRGTLELVVKDDVEGDVSVQVRFGPDAGSTSQTTVQTGIDILDKIHGENFNPQMLMMSPSVKIIGDMGLALQAAALIMVQ